MKQYIRLNASEIYNSMEYGVRFLSDNELWSEAFIGFCEYCKEYNINSNIPSMRNFFKFYEQKGYEVGAIIDFWENEEYFDYEEDNLSLNYKQCKIEMLNYYRNTADMYEFFDRFEDYMNKDDLYIEYPQFLGYNAGTVGYSDWSYYITTEDNDENFVQDLWEGWNFYDVEILDEQGVYSNNICNCYLPNDEDLIECVKCNFGISENEINLIDNEFTTYFNLKKYAMIPASYEFVEVK